MNFIRRTAWGYEVFINKRQVRAGVGMEPWELIGASKITIRLWRKRGLLVLA